MPDAYVIEVGGRAAGIVARDPRDQTFNFFAASRPFDSMEGQQFTDPLAAERAARRLVKEGRHPPAQADVTAGRGSKA